MTLRPAAYMQLTWHTYLRDPALSLSLRRTDLSERKR